MNYNELDYLDVILPLNEVEDYTPTEEEVIEFYD